MKSDPIARCAHCDRVAVTKAGADYLCDRHYDPGAKPPIALGSQADVDAAFGAGFYDQPRIRMPVADIQKISVALPETAAVSTLSESQAAIAAECDEIKAMLLEKNRDYGDSALHPVRIFSKASADEQILVRIDDKVNRVIKGKAAGEDVVKDLIGYFILLRVKRRLDAAAKKEGP